ncbi:hypothetical protein GCM10025857_27190 [Alicyclobacillus contaminans]|uniref:PaaD-like zinc ribbon domain-containing protein n=1 Tax=Alicyclobacillus contaminans TaxID=392016 RepID=UPI0004238E84|nr:hypothetical protein GCM10025857_27190 [Alicyclobacillus contaminans]
MRPSDRSPSRVKSLAAVPKNPVQCPFCGSERVHRLSQFGKAQLVSQYLCDDCRSVFERVRW